MEGGGGGANGDVNGVEGLGFIAYQYYPMSVHLSVQTYILCLNAWTDSNRILPLFHLVVTFLHYLTAAV